MGSWRKGSFTVIEQTWRREEQKKIFQLHKDEFRSTDFLNGIKRHFRRILWLQKKKKKCKSATQKYFCRVTLPPPNWMVWLWERENLSLNDIKKHCKRVLLCEKRWLNKYETSPWCICQRNRKFGVSSWEKKKGDQ